MPASMLFIIDAKIFSDPPLVIGPSPWPGMIDRGILRAFPRRVGAV